MTEWIWDGEMDCGFEELAKRLAETCRKFTKIMLKTTEFSLNEETKTLISLECMERFESITYILAENIKDGIYYEYEDLDNNSQNALKLNSWILLGSLTETTLQMFLAFYMDDYKNSKWQQWEEFKTGQVQSSISASIQNLVDQGIIKNNQGKSLKKAIKETIKKHTIEHQVEKIMLDELIQLFNTLELFDEDELDYLKKIQSNRNGIHSFQKRTIGTWFDLKYCTRFFCFLLEWVMFHLPDIPDEEYY